MLILAYVDVVRRIQAETELSQIKAALASDGEVKTSALFTRWRYTHYNVMHAYIKHVAEVSGQIVCQHLSVLCSVTVYLCLCCELRWH
jgi:hypothetical protein